MFFHPFHTKALFHIASIALAALAVRSSLVTDIIMTSFDDPSPSFGMTFGMSLLCACCVACVVQARGDREELR